MSKVVFVTNFLGNGGSARVMSIIAEYVNKKNIEVEILSFMDEKGVYKINENIKYTVLKCKSKNKTIKKIERIFKIRKILKRNKESTIIAFEYFVNMQTIIANLFLKNKLIISERADPNITGNGKIIRRLRNFLYKYTDILVCQTDEAKEYFPKKVQEKTVVIPNPIMPNLPKRYEGERRKEIVTFCRIVKQKNLPMMIEAFEKLLYDYPDYKLLIYGDGPEKEHIREIIKQKKLQEKIELKEFVQNIHELVVDCCMFVISSDYEGISNSMLEAMGMGLPTIATDCPCGGARMMIKNNENGILIPVGDTISLYKAMKQVIDNPDFAERLSKNATKINDRLEQNKICKKWIDLI